MNDPNPLLTTTDLTIGYTSKKVARIISEKLNLNLWPGQLVCLLGPNGAGKSTLMRTLAGLQPTLAGDIVIGNQLLSLIKPADLAQKLSLVLTERVEVGNLTAGEVVTLGRTPYTGWLGTLSAIDKLKIDIALEATDTQRHVNQRIYELSDGERQKVMLARALAQDTDLILLDEPTAHLDLPSRIEMMQLLHSLAQETGKAILLSTHELDLALQAADQLWLMKPGGAIITGVPEDLVLNGSFESAFSKSGFFFDKSTGMFSIHTTNDLSPVFLDGDPKLVFWTKRALQRNRFKTVSDVNAPTKITAAENKYGPSWKLEMPPFSSDFTTLEALLKQMKASSI